MKKGKPIRSSAIRASEVAEGDGDICLGITEEEADLLGGFTSRAICAIAHLREAWMYADSKNRPGVERALRALLSDCHSLGDAEQGRLAVKVLLWGHMRGSEMLRAVRP